MASSTPPSTSYAHKTHYVYDVFINHRGPDCKKPFATDLHKRLTDSGLRVFLDEQALQTGEDLTSQIIGAIREASVHIAIFSENYAQSVWCLKELVLMLGSEKPILPVFYGVKPDVVRWTGHEKQGVYATALRALEKKITVDSLTQQEKPRYPSATIEGWRNALVLASDISGFELAKCDGEHQLIEQVVEGVLRKVKRPVHVSKHPVGLDEKVRDFETTVSLQPQSRDTRVIGIVGLGGVGKTTLANEIFNRRLSDCDRSCRLSDVRGTSLKYLQSKLLEDLAGWKENKIDDIDDGIAKIERYLGSPRALIILDNVDNIEQLNALLVPVEDTVGPGSLILITSRNRDVLTASGIVESIYELKGLQDEQSRELFCWHAFGQPDPVERYALLVDKFVPACGGLPLSLEVNGAHLRGQFDLSFWKAYWSKISKTPHEKIQAQLKISYDNLNKEEKQIFLDIACFFIGEDSNTAVRIWDGSGWNGWLGLWKLENRCLVKVDSENRIRMHDHLRDLGRDMAKEEPGSPLRLWCPPEDLDNQSPVRGIKNLAGRSCSGADMDRLKLLSSRLKLLSAEGDCVKTILGFGRLELIWLCCCNFLGSSLPSSTSVKNLRVLKVHGEKLQLETLWQGESQVPLELRELDIAATHEQKIPKSIGKLKELQKFVFKPVYSNDMGLESLPDEFCHLKSLEYLELNHCRGLKSLPNSFGDLANLQHIKLVHLHDLEKLPDSFVNLRNLQYILLSDCKSLRMLPDSFGNGFRNLQHIDLSGCHQLEMLPKYFCKLTNLQHIDLSNCYNLKMDPNSFQHLLQLKYLNMKECRYLTISNQTFGKITTLEKLFLPDSNEIKVLPAQVTRQELLRQLSLICPELEELPREIGKLKHLEHLQLGSKTLKTLPDSLGDLESLEELELHFCNKLECLPHSMRKLTQLKKLSMVKMTNLKLLEINECPSSELPRGNVGREMETLPDRRGLRAFRLYLNIQHLKIENCYHLVEVQALPRTLIKLELEGCSVLEKIEGLYDLAKLQTLKVTFSKNLRELSGIETLASLEMLYLKDVKNLNSISGLGELKKLQILHIIKCRELKKLQGVEDAMSLKKLTACECPNLQWGRGVKEQLRQRLHCRFD